jgi:hypothetical protein
MAAVITRHRLGGQADLKGQIIIIGKTCAALERFGAAAAFLAYFEATVGTFAII